MLLLSCHNSQIGPTLQFTTLNAMDCIGLSKESDSHLSKLQFAKARFLRYYDCRSKEWVFRLWKICISPNVIRGNFNEAKVLKEFL